MDVKVIDMTVLVVYESMFGDAQQIAEAIAAGISESRPVTCLEVGKAPDTVTPDTTLVVAGSPNHAFGLPRPQSRSDAAERTEASLVSPGRGLREWLDVVSAEVPTRAATFDTRMDHPKALTRMDHAARASAKRLKKAGFQIVTDSQHFLVSDVQGPLLPGELDRAQQWGGLLAGFA